MKLKRLLLACSLFLAGGVLATSAEQAKNVTVAEAADTTASVTFADDTSVAVNAQDFTEYSLDSNVTLTTSKGTGSSTPKYYTSGSAVRFYANNTLTFSLETGYFKSIVLTCASTKYVPNGSPLSGMVSTGSISVSSTVATLDGYDATTKTVTLTNTASGQIRITKVDVIYESADATNTYTITLNGNYGDDSVTSTAKVVPNENGEGSYELPDCPFDGLELTSFVSWNTASDGTGTSYNVGDIVTVSGDTNFYAQWEAFDGVVYNLVNSTSDLKLGDSIIVAAKDSNFAIGEDAGNYRAQTQINKTSDASKLYFEEGNTVAIFSLVEGNAEGTYAFKCADGYLNASGGTADNYLNTVSTLSDTSSFTITVEDGNASVVTYDSATTKNTLRYNSASVRFSCYASGQNDISLYSYTPSDPVESITIDEALTLSVGASKGLSVSVLPATAANKNVVWSVKDNSDVVSVDDGVVTALKAGTVTIVAASEENAELYDECVVTVKEVSTIADLLSVEDEEKTMLYTISGKVTEIINTTYGNFYIEDETGSIYVYGATQTADTLVLDGTTYSFSNPKDFANIGLEVNDVVTMQVLKTSYNSNPQVQGIITNIVKPVTNPLADVQLDTALSLSYTETEEGYADFRNFSLFFRLAFDFSTVEGATEAGIYLTKDSTTIAELSGNGKIALTDLTDTEFVVKLTGPENATAEDLDATIYMVAYVVVDGTTYVTTTQEVDFKYMLNAYATGASNETTKAVCAAAYDYYFAE